MTLYAAHPCAMSSPYWDGRWAQFSDAWSDTNPIPGYVNTLPIRNSWHSVSGRVFLAPVAITLDLVSRV